MISILKVIVFLLLAVPFIYMAYDVIRDLGSKLARQFRQKAKPVLSSLAGFLTD